MNPVSKIGDGARLWRHVGNAICSIGSARSDDVYVPRLWLSVTGGKPSPTRVPVSTVLAGASPAGKRFLEGFV